MLEQVFRDDWGRVLASLVGLLGDIELAEDAAQEAFATAAALVLARGEKELSVTRTPSAAPRSPTAPNIGRNRRGSPDGNTWGAEPGTIGLDDVF